MDVLLLSRIQFAFVISVHILFAAFSIGLASWLAFLEYRWLRSHDRVWKDLYFFWLKVFAVTFGMGVVSGVVMGFQIGTNWSVFAERAGSVMGPLFGFEVLSAFFLEATFLGVMLFGWKRVPDRLHFLATCMVAFGTLMSTFWILAANSWMHTPQGHEVVDGIVHVVSWTEVIFNPSFPHRLVHMTLAAFLCTCFLVGGMAGWYLRRRKHQDAAARMLRLATAFALIAVPLQILAGDLHGLNTVEHQPLKVAAMEGHWHRLPEGEGMPLLLWAVPDPATESNRQALAIPRLGSLILTHSLDGQIDGLASVAPEDRPPVAPVFYAFRVMIGIGLAMLAVALASGWQWRRGRLESSRGLHLAWNLMLPSGFVAMIAGWFVTEIGRQPYLIHGVLRTADAVSDIDTSSVATSLTAYVAVYLVVFGFGMAYLVRILRRGPEPQESAPDAQGGQRTPARPLSAPGPDPAGED